MRAEHPSLTHRRCPLLLAVRSPLPVVISLSAAALLLPAFATSHLLGRISIQLLCAPLSAADGADFPSQGNPAAADEFSHLDEKERKKALSKKRKAEAKVKAQAEQEEKKGGKAGKEEKKDKKPADEVSLTAACCFVIVPSQLPAAVLCACPPPVHRCDCPLVSAGSGRGEACEGRSSFRRGPQILENAADVLRRQNRDPHCCVQGVPQIRCVSPSVV